MARNKLRLLFWTLPIAAIALTIGVSQGSGGSNAVTAPIQKDSDECGAASGHGSIGTVTLSANKGTIYATVQLRKANPNTNYYAYLYYNVPMDCDYFVFTKIPTDANGNANKSFSGPENGHHYWFVDVVASGGVDNENASVHLG